jgi:integrase
MAKISFWIRSTVTGKPATVYARYTNGRSIEQWSPSRKTLNPEYWSNKSQSVKQRILFTDAFSEEDKADFEATLQRMRDFILKESNALEGEKPAKEWLSEVIEKFYAKPVKKKAPETLRQYIDRFYSEAKAGTRLATVHNSKRPYAYETLRSIKGTKLSFEMFADETKQKSNFNDIDREWYDEFLKFFYKRGCSANYIGRHIKTLKTIMRIAREEGLHNNVEIEKKSFKAISEPSDSIYLTDEEVQRMFKKDLSFSPVLARCRDIFLCGVYTAQRYSDYSRITKSMVKEEDGAKYIELVQKKTGEKVFIPIRPELDKILQRYDYTLPKSFEQKINDNIKKVGEKCGIKEVINLESRKSGLRVTTTEKKYNLIKTHTARRTGCTLMYLAGVQPIDIMKVSGHRTEKEFLKYIKVGKKETAINLSRHPYFIGNPLSVAK